MRIQIQKVSKKFGRVWALEEISLELEPGQIVGVLGANGAGKTTLLNCLAGVAIPSDGRIPYDGHEFHRGKGLGGLWLVVRAQGGLAARPAVNDPIAKMPYLRISKADSVGGSFRKLCACEKRPLRKSR